MMPMGQAPYGQPVQPYAPAPYGPPMPYGQPAAPAPTPYGVVPPGMSPQATLQGQGVPVAMRGRTIAQAQQMQQPQLPIGGAPRGYPPTYGMQPMAPSQPAHAPAAPAHTPSTPPAGRSSFWANPEESISRLIDSRIAPLAAQTVKSQVAEQIPDFQVLEPHIEELFRYAEPSIRTNPQAWLMASRMVRGSLMEQGAYPAPQPQQLPPQQAPQANLMPAVPAPQAPLHSFFTEAPTAPTAGPNAMGGRAPSPDEIHHAQKFGMSIQDYMNWKYGVGGGGTPVGSW